MSDRLYFRKEPIGTVTIESPLQPAEVIQNLKVRGKEWRESAVPPLLRKFASGLGVQINGSEFQTKWYGNSVGSPVCFGIVQPYGDGSRIRAGFKLDPKEFVFLPPVTLLAVIQALQDQVTFTWVLVGFFGLLWLYAGISLVRRRSGEPMRSQLIEVLTTAAQHKPERTEVPFPMVSANGP